MLVSSPLVIHIGLPCQYATRLMVGSLVSVEMSGDRIGGYRDDYKFSIMAHASSLDPRTQAYPSIHSLKFLPANLLSGSAHLRMLLELESLVLLFFSNPSPDGIGFLRVGRW